MVELQVGDQTIRYDHERTAAIYAALDGGWAEGCRCVGCRNLMAQRDRIYPAPFRELLDQLGVDSNKEAEAVAEGPHSNGSHNYHGWFFLAGELIAAGDQVVASESPYFAYHFTRVGPCPKEFRVVPHIGIEFDAHIPWILEESWDSDFAPKR